MENFNIKKKQPANGIWGGVLILFIGVALLLGNLDIDVPHYVFTWSTFLVLLGVIIGFKRNFKGGTWLVLIVVGGIFTADDIADFDYNIGRLIWPAVLISVGAFLVLRPSCRGRFGRGRRRFNRFGAMDDPQGEPSPLGSATSIDYLDSVNVFGGSHQKIFSKNFQGGEVVSVFGGCDVDLSQAEFHQTIIIDITAIFGGCKIIVPPSWEVKSEITAIFGGVDDKRNIMPVSPENQKRIILKGVAMFGGVDIRNY